MTAYVFDTNVVSQLLRRNHRVESHFKQILLPETLIIGCPLVWYEIQRGLLKLDARRQLKEFETLFQGFEWQNYTLSDWAMAAVLWSQRHKNGIPIADADLLIGAFARTRNAILVTNNVTDFVNLGLTVEDWT
jgi:tRNA(fMet)-specific endonuclease VapC